VYGPLMRNEENSSIVTDEELSEEYIIPNAFDKRVVKAVSASVSKAAYK